MEKSKLKMFLCGFIVCVLMSNALANNSNKDDTTDRVLKIEETLNVILEQNARLEQRVTVLEEENARLKQVLADVVDTSATQRRDEDQSVSVTESEGHHHGKINRSKILPSSDVPLNPKRQLSASTIAFTAVVSTASLHVGPGETIVYNSVITNVGGTYNSQTGVFTAPVSGVYIFNFAEMVEPGHNEYLELVKDGNHVMWNYGHAVGASHYASSSRTATVEVAKGGQVWVQTQNSGHHGTGIIHGNTFSTFSGWVVAITE